VPKRERLLHKKEQPAGAYFGRVFFTRTGVHFARKRF
jgi:hypothetical protein